MAVYGVNWVEVLNISSLISACYLVSYLSSLTRVVHFKVAIVANISRVFLIWKTEQTYRVIYQTNGKELHDTEKLFKNSKIVWLRCAEQEKQM